MNLALRDGQPKWTKRPLKACNFRLSHSRPAICLRVLCGSRFCVTRFSKGTSCTVNLLAVTNVGRSTHKLMLDGLKPVCNSQTHTEEE